MLFNILLYNWNTITVNIKIIFFICANLIINCSVLLLRQIMCTHKVKTLCLENKTKKVKTLLSYLELRLRGKETARAFGRRRRKKKKKTMLVPSVKKRIRILTK